MYQPFSLNVVNETATVATVVLEPLRQGFGHTLGVALRRVMLSSLRGAAVTKVRIKGVNHQFTTLSGMREDVVELILNLKQLRVAYAGDKPETLKLSEVGPKEVTGKNLVAPPTIKIANQDLVLAILADKKSKLTMELVVESGVGYLTAEEQGKQKLGVIPIDASFSPVKEVFYTIESTRIGRRTDFDKLILTVKTDGAIKPRDAVIEAAKILVDHFQQIVTPVAEVGHDDTVASVGSDEGVAVMRLSVDELDLPTRIANALRRGGYKTVAQLAKADRTQLAKVKNLGEKSLDEVIETLRERGVQFPS